jgi:hypothetical protein
VPIRARRYLQRVLVTAALGLGIVPTICRAQESSPPGHTLTPLLGTMPAPLPSAAGDIVVPDERTDLRQPPNSRAVETGSSRLGVFLPLYASFAGLQVLDAHSTLRALNAGGSERNPLLRDIAGRPAALFALKAGVTASTILLTEKLRVKNRVGAIVLMVALDSAYAMVVVHNYRARP